MLRLPNLNLGALEMAVLESLWRIGEGDVKQVQSAIGSARAAGLNTVQSTLDRLFRKGILDRRKVSHAFVYHARMQRAELVGRAITAVLSATGGGGGELLTAFVDLVGRTDPAELAELEALLAERISTARGAA